MNLSLIDSHCHPPLSEESDSDNPPDWLQRANESGVKECIAVGTDSEDWARYRALANRFPDQIHWTAGLHPCHVEDDFREHLAALPAYLESSNSKKPCALGEIGLDFTRLPKGQEEKRIEQQRKAFVDQLALAASHDLPVIVHSRGTVPECLSLIEETGFPAEQTIFHCFAEGPETLKKLQAVGAKCSFTGIITFKNAREVRGALESNGLENLILETDSPYLSPEPFRGKRNEPARVSTLARYCADFFGTTPEKVAETTRRNTEAFFGLSS